MSHDGGVFFDRLPSIGKIFTMPEFVIAGVYH
jgi:hypothetical protein